MLEEKSSLKVTRSAKKAVKLVVSAVATLGIGAILAVERYSRAADGRSWAVVVRWALDGLYGPYIVPFVSILQQGEQPFAMFVDLQNKYDWVFQPVVGYPSVATG